MLEGATEAQYRERRGLEALLKSRFLRDRSVAIDGGAHVGTWSEMLSAHFESVIAVEAGPAYPLLENNMADFANVSCLNAALCDHHNRMASFHRKPGGKYTGYRVKQDPEGEITGFMIDDLSLERCGLIKLDIEGYELPALRGAVDTIQRLRPFVLVEIAGHTKHAGYRERDLRNFLDQHGYSEVWQWGVDRGFKHKDTK